MRRQNKSMEEFLGELVADCQPVCRMKPLWLRLLIWIGLAVIGIGVLGTFLGWRGDLLMKFRSTYFVAELIVLFLLSFWAAYAAFKVCVPGQRCRGVYFWVIPLVVWLVMVLVSFLPELAEHGVFAVIGNSHFLCVRGILILAVIPFLASFFLVRFGAVVYPKYSGYMVALSAAAMGALGLQMLCPIDDVGHYLVWHMSPVFGIAVLGVYLAKYFSRW